MSEGLENPTQRKLGLGVGETSRKSMGGKHVEPPPKPDANASHTSEPETKENLAIPVEVGFGKMQEANTCHSILQTRCKCKGESRTRLETDPDVGNIQIAITFHRELGFTQGWTFWKAYEVLCPNAIGYI